MAEAVPDGKQYPLPATGDLKFAYEQTKDKKKLDELMVSQFLSILLISQLVLVVRWVYNHALVARDHDVMSVNYAFKK